MKENEEKVLLQLAFLEGEMSIGKEDNSIIVPLIKYQEMKDGKNITFFDTEKHIRFERTEKYKDGKPIFVPNLNEKPFEN